MKKIIIYRSNFLGRINAALFKYFLVFLIIFSPYGVIASESENHTPQDYQNNIYVAPGAIIHGLEHITINASAVVLYIAPGTIISGESNINMSKTVEISPVCTTERPTNKEHKALGLSKEFVAVCKVKDISLQRLQEKLQNRTLKTIYTAGDKSPFEFLDPYRPNFATVLNNTSSISFAAILNLRASCVHSYVFPNTKQNFYTIVVHIGFGILSTTFLRGPPQLVAQG